MPLGIRDKGFSEYVSSLMGEIDKLKQEALGGKCYLCGENCSSYANSHSITQAVLNNICKGGNYYNYYSLLPDTIDFMNRMTGRNNAGTFRLLCPRYENDNFKKYEDEKNLLSVCNIDDSILREIALKNYLFQVSKCNNNLSTLSILAKRLEDLPSSLYKPILEQEIAFGVKMNLYQLDIYEKCRIYDQKYKECELYDLIYGDVLNKNTEFVIQTAFLVEKGLSGQQIGKTPFHICVLPLKNNKTSVLFFSYNSNACKNDSSEMQFRGEFNSLSETEKMKLMNYVIFATCEDYFMSENVMKKFKSVDLIQQRLSLDLSKYTMTRIPNLFD